MSTRWRPASLVALSVAAATLAAAGGEPQREPAAVMAGRALFREHCVACHGASGRGDGRLAELLIFRPADLTLLSRHNGGSFPFDQVVRIIDGRRPVKGHGGSEMPVWGDAFRLPQESYDERKAQERIRNVARFLETLQPK
ncbi:MAG TPA: c-type cytochrome [Vicinamibacteria bacterium]